MLKNKTQVFLDFDAFDLTFSPTEMLKIFKNLAILHQEGGSYGAFIAGTSGLFQKMTSVPSYTIVHESILSVITGHRLHELDFGVIMANPIIIEDVKHILSDVPLIWIIPPKMNLSNINYKIPNVLFYPADYIRKNTQTKWWSLVTSPPLYAKLVQEMQTEGIPSLENQPPPKPLVQTNVIPKPPEKTLENPINSSFSFSFSSLPNEEISEKINTFNAQGKSKMDMKNNLITWIAKELKLRGESVPYPTIFQKVGKYFMNL